MYRIDNVFYHVEYSLPTILTKHHNSMKQILTLFIFLFFTKITFPQNAMQFKVAYAELYATYDFLEKISDNYPENAFKAEFLNSKYNTEKYKNLIRQIDTLKMDYAYNFEQYSPTLKSALASRSLIEKNLIESKTVQEFKAKSFGIIPNDELSTLSTVIEFFIPIYNELIFQPHKKAFENHLSSINKELLTDKVSKIYNNVMRFYGTALDKDIPFEVIAYPTIGKSGIGARAFLNIAVIRFPLNFKSYDVLFSVMLHEIFHIGYDSQPISLKNNLKNWFYNTQSLNSQYAFLLLNEVLATTLGNGYAYENLKGQMDPEDWYYVKYVNLFAKEIYPLVGSYLAQGKTIDQEFIKSYVGIYDSKFSSWSKELDNLMTYRVILSDDIDDTRYFRRNYPYTLHKAIPIVTVKGLQEIKQQPLTKVIIIANHHKEKLNLIKNNFSELKGIKLNPKQEFIKTIDLKDRTKLIIINKHTSTVETLMETEFKERRLK